MIKGSYIPQFASRQAVIYKGRHRQRMVKGHQKPAFASWQAVIYIWAGRGRE